MAATDKSFVTKPIRCGYVNVFTPRLNMHNNREEFSLQMILHKEKDKAIIADIQSAIDEILKKVFPKGVPATAHNPLVDAREYHESKDKPLPEYLVDCFTMNVKNVMRPGVVDRDRMDVIDPTAFQSGDWARVNFNLFGYSKGNGGVSASLQNLMVWDKGEALGSRARAEDVFGNIEEEEDVYA